MNIIIPMAGLGSRFTKYGFTENKYLLPIDINLTKMIEKAILSLNAVKFSTKFIFIMRKYEGFDTEKISKYLIKICNDNNYLHEIIYIDYLTEGPASTAYLAKNLIDNDVPLIISNSDQVLDWNFNSFIEQSIKYDGCVLTYKPNYKLNIGDIDKHSFVSKDEYGMPNNFTEKIVISDEALVGVHYYKKGSYFIKAYEEMYKKNIRAPNNEFYLSLTYKLMLELGYTVGTYLIDNVNEIFYPVGEPEDYFNYYNKKCPIIIEKIENHKNLNIKNDYFSISLINKDTIYNENNTLCIFLKGKINSDKYLFINENINIILDSYFLVIKENIILNSIDINNYIRGWLIGDFEPNIIKTKDYEIALLTHKKNEMWKYHYHMEADEINILIKGSMIINNIKINQGHIFIIKKNIIACPIFLEDCKILCVKIPSRPKDKYII